MFDVGFSELIVIAVVALIVIGPERLPGVARTAGHLLGRLQRYVNDVKADINREMQLDELKKVQQDVIDQARGVEQSVNEQLKSVETSLNQSIAAGIEEKSATTADPEPPPPVAPHLPPGILPPAPEISAAAGTNDKPQA
jgi:sec-independent protein translocase protein TatB